MRRAAPWAACVLCAAALSLIAPGRARADGPALPVALQAAALYAPATGQYLYLDDADAERAIASTTKMMTALVTLQHVRDLGTVFAYPAHRLDPEDSQIGLHTGQRMTVHDLLVAMMLPSADDAAWDLAYNVGHGSVARFLGWMNDDAIRLGLRDTHFATPSGLDTPGNHSTAADLDRLAAYDLAHFPVFARIVKMSHATLATGPVASVTNLNQLVGEYPWITGVKTGHTSQAGWLLVASGRRDGLELVASALGVATDPGSDADALALLQYGYDDFALRTPLRARQIVARLAVEDRPGVRVPVTAARSFTRVLARRSAVSVRDEVPHRLRGPLPAGAVVGSAAVLVSGRVLARVPLVLPRALPAVSSLAIAARFTGRAWVLALLAVVAAVLVGVGLRIAGRRSAGGGGRPGGGRPGGGVPALDVRAPRAAVAGRVRDRARRRTGFGA